MKQYIMTARINFPFSSQLIKRDMTAHKVYVKVVGDYDIYGFDDDGFGYNSYLYGFYMENIRENDRYLR